MSDINTIYTIDKEFKKDKKNLLEKFEKNISEETAVYLKKKKELISKINQAGSFKSSSGKSDLNNEDAKKDLEKKASKNIKKLEEFLKKNLV